MKLWMKQTLPALLVVLLLIGMSMIVFVSIGTETMLQTALNNCQYHLNAIAGHIESVDSMNGYQTGEDEVTKRAVVAFYFGKSAGLLQNEKAKFALVINDAYAFQTTAIRFTELLPVQDGLQAEYKLFLLDGAYTYLGYQNMTVLGLPITIYHASDAAETIRSIGTITLIAQIVMGVCILSIALILPLILRLSLRPLSTLTRMAETIADGAYDCRTHYQSEDEVGKLSASFDRMADTIEQKISTLEETSKRRELLLSALTHELKTPMTAIIGYADGCLTMPLNEDEKTSAMKGIFDSAKRVERLSQKMMQLISYTECTIINMRRVSVPQLLESVKDETNAQRQQRKLKLEIQAEVDTVIGDSDLLFSLLTNLVDNACKASSENATVYLSAHQKEGKAWFEVRDEGCGIPKEEIGLIFEPFYRVDKARDRKLGGVGLGLSLCQMIAEAHGGSISVTSEVGKGTAIKVYMFAKGNKYE